MQHQATYTHGHHESVVRAHAARTVENSAFYLRDRIQPGMRVLDVGCGPGSITLDFAKRVGSEGFVVGVDASEAVLETARRAAAEAGITNVAFRVADAYAVEADDDSFDVVHAHQLLQHLSDPSDALREWRRVSKGLVAARDIVYSSASFFPVLPELVRWRTLVGELTRRNGGEPDAGTHLKSWAMRAGFSNVTTGVDTWLFDQEPGRHFWGGQWVARVVEASFADGTERFGLSDDVERAAISRAWDAWQHDDEAWFAVMHGWILAEG